MDIKHGSTFSKKTTSSISRNTPKKASSTPKSAFSTSHKASKPPGIPKNVGSKLPSLKKDKK